MTVKQPRRRDVISGTYKVRGPVKQPTLGGMVLRWRTEAGLTQRQLAELIGVGFPYISKIEHDVYFPSLKKAEAIAQATGNDPDDLYPFTGQLPTDIAEIVDRHPGDSFLLLRRMAKRKSREFEDLLSLTFAKRKGQP